MKNKAKPKVLFIVQFPPPVHGSSIMCDFIRKSKLVNGEFDCDYLNLSTSRKISEIGKKPLLKLWRFLCAYLILLGKLITHKYDLVYIANTCYGIGFLKDMPFIVLCKLVCKKVVLHQHNQGARFYVHRKGYRWLMPKVYRGVKVILLSWNLYEDIKDLVAKDDVLICPNGIEQRIDVINNLKQVKSHVPRVLFLSNLLKEKGVELLLDAAEILKSEGLTFNIDMVGGETADFNRVSFQREIDCRNLTGIVYFHGPKYGEDKELYWEQADIFVLPTLRDCFPLVICEAMQHGLACVASYEGAIPDLIRDGVTGFVFEKGNLNKLVICLRKLILNSSLRQAMGKAGFEHYKNNLTIEVYEKHLVECLRICLN